MLEIKKSKREWERKKRGIMRLNRFWYLSLLHFPFREWVNFVCFRARFVTCVHWNMVFFDNNNNKKTDSIRSKINEAQLIRTASGNLTQYAESSGKFTIISLSLSVCSQTGFNHLIHNPYACYVWNDAQHPSHVCHRFVYLLWKCDLIQLITYFHISQFLTTDHRNFFLCVNDIRKIEKYHEQYVYHCRYIQWFSLISLRSRQSLTLTANEIPI